MKYAELWRQNFDKNLWQSKRFSARRLIKKFRNKIEKMNTGQLLAKAAHNLSLPKPRSKWSATVILNCITLPQIKTQLRWSCKFLTVPYNVHSWFQQCKKCKNPGRVLVPFILCMVSKRSDMDHTVLPAKYTMPTFPS